MCQDKESISSYNARVIEAIEFASMENETYTISQKGRSEEEKGFVLVEKGIYKGYGYADKNTEFTSLEEYKTVLVAQKDNRDIQRILKSWKRSEEKTQEEEGRKESNTFQKWWTNEDLESEKNKKEEVKESVNLSNVGLFGLM